MWIQVRSMDGRKSVQVDGLSKLTKIEDLRERLVELFEAEPSQQRLFYRGKQVNETHLIIQRVKEKNNCSFSTLISNVLSCCWVIFDW